MPKLLLNAHFFLNVYIYGSILEPYVHSYLLIDSYMIIASKLEFDIITPNSIQNNKLCPKVGFFVYLGCLPQMGALVHCAE